MKLNINAPYPTVDPGSFRHQITLLQQIVGSDAAGSNVTYAIGDSPVTIWASIDYLRGSELIKSGVDISQTFLKITSWFRKEFQPNTRIQTASWKQYIIQSVEDVHEMHVYMIFYCLGVGENN